MAPSSSSPPARWASLADRLNPNRAAFDPELKAAWKSLSKSERKRMVAEDKRAIRELKARGAKALPFEAEPDDHCETSPVAYSHIAPVLHAIAQRLGKAPGELKIYDPYYCAGGTVRHLHQLGFGRVYNQCEDFYEVIAQERVPTHDVVVTNPPYSGDHFDFMQDSWDWIRARDSFGTQPALSPRQTTARGYEEDAEVGESPDAFATSLPNNVPRPRPRQTIRARQTAIQSPMMMDAIRRTRLGLKGREVTGKLTFVVPKDRALQLPPTEDAVAARETLCRRFPSLHPTRREDDGPYFDAIEKGTVVTLVTALPPQYNKGGWRCHAKSPSAASDDSAGQCLQANRAEDESCTKCQRPKPKLRAEYLYLRLLPRGMRRQRREYERIIKDADSELNRCDAAESEALERIAAATEASAHTAGESTEDDEELTMRTDLVSGVWQQVDARSLLPLLAERKTALNKKLASARAELSIMMQAAFDLAVIHAQRVARRFLVRLHLDEIRQSVRDLARFSAAVEIQRIMRSKLARLEADRLRTLRDHYMATRIQSLARMRFAVLERKRLHAIYTEKLRHRCATIIQSLYRCHACKIQAKLLAEEKRRRLEEEKQAAQASLEEDSAVLLQKQFRRILDTAKCANRRIEMGLHTRLLMYLERYAVDGCMFSFVKSINDDYIRYERTIRHTIEREEKMAKTFVEKVVNARDGDHQKSWENYLNLQASGDVSSRPTAERTAKKKQSLQANAMRIYGAPPEKRRGSSRTISTSKAKPKSVQEKVDRAGGTSGSSYQKEAKALTNLQRIQDRLRGQYLRFDLPSGLDDTVARFIMAVALRYKFEAPDESSLHGTFERPAVDKDHHQKCVAYADPLIQQLHGQGIIFIRDLFPAEKMAETLSKLGVADEFLFLSNSLLNVLHQMSGGDWWNRKYLMMSCRRLLDTQRELRGKRNTTGSGAEHTFNIASFLGECGAAGADDYDDDDNPGGIWTGRARRPIKTHATYQQERVGRSPNPLQNATRKKRNRSWVVPYTAKVISETEAKHPALKAYRKGQTIK